MTQAEELYKKLTKEDLLKHLIEQANLMKIKRERIPHVGNYYFIFDDGSVIDYHAKGIDCHETRPPQKELTSNDRKKIKIAARMDKRRNRA